MFYSKKDLENARKKGEETLEKMEEEKKGHKYVSEAQLQVTCLHCKHELFEEGNALLNTRVATFFDVDWLNASATILICKKCGFVHWFDKGVNIMNE